MFLIANYVRQQRNASRAPAYAMQQPAPATTAPPYASYAPYAPSQRGPDPFNATLPRPPSFDENLRLPAIEEADAGRDPRYRDGAVTPPPTPEEVEFLTTSGGINWNKVMTKEYWMLKKTWITVAIIAVSIALTVVFAIEKNNIIHWFQPIGNKIKSWPAGWLIPVGVLIIISFPPLFGHELILLLIGIIWGIWVGFAIAAAGTLIGELLNFFTFRFCCKTRARKFENKNLMYAGFSELVRNGGFRIILAARFSLLPGHLTTMVFATCEVSTLTFIAAAVLSLPKQLALVYVGVAYDQSGSGDASNKSKIASTLIVVVTSIVTVLTMRYIRSEMAPLKGPIVYQRRKERQAKLAKGVYESPDENGVYAPQPRPVTNPARMAEEGQMQYGQAPSYAQPPHGYKPQANIPLSNNGYSANPFDGQGQ